MAGDLLTSLIDKEALLIEGLWCNAVVADIALKKVSIWKLIVLLDMNIKWMKMVSCHLKWI